MSTEGKPDVEKTSTVERDSPEEIDLYSFHEQNAGRLVIDPACVPIVFEGGMDSALFLDRLHLPIGEIRGNSDDLACCNTMVFRVYRLVYAVQGAVKSVSGYW